MQKHECWPPPNDWTEVVIPWSEMLVPHTFRKPLIILKWVDDQPGGRYHLSGWKATKGFSFRFEQAADATAFTLKWR